MVSALRNRITRTGLKESQCNHHNTPISNCTTKSSPGLPDPVAPVLCLLVVVGVEVDVVEDDGVGGGEVDAQPARLRRQDEVENTAVRVELVYQVLPANARGKSSTSAQFSVRGCVSHSLFASASQKSQLGQIHVCVYWVIFRHLS